MSSRAPAMPSFIGFDRPLLSTTRSIPPPLSGFASSSDAFILITLIKGNLPPIQRKGRARSGRTDKRARQAERDAPAVRFRTTTEIGRASCRERVFKYELNTVVAGSLTTKT